jgi:hypothetical protein
MCHGKNKFITARANSSRQEQIIHGKSKLLTARANSSRQNKNKKTGQRFGQRVRLLPIYNFML